MAIDRTKLDERYERMLHGDRTARAELEAEAHTSEDARILYDLFRPIEGADLEKIYALVASAVPAPLMHGSRRCGPRSLANACAEPAERVLEPGPVPATRSTPRQEVAACAACRRFVSRLRC
jgi:hypothetical protein